MSRVSSLMMNHILLQTLTSVPIIQTIGNTSTFPTDNKEKSLKRKLPEIWGNPAITSTVSSDSCSSKDPLSFVEFIELLENIPRREKTNAVIDEENPLASFSYIKAKQLYVEGITKLIQNCFSTVTYASLSLVSVVKRTFNRCSVTINK